MQLGVEVLLNTKSLLAELSGKKVGLVAHPASVDKQLNHSLDLVFSRNEIDLVCGFGPQHGIMGDKQYNMEETVHAVDPKYKIPIYSLYSETRRPTEDMLKNLDVVLFDLQDIGCRIYTYVATLVYMIEACDKLGKALWVLDRPNPVGRKIEGSYLQAEWKSFVGEVELPMRHGLTLGELAKWYAHKNNFALDLKIVAMQGYNPEAKGQWGWDESIPWVNPSPQIPSLRSCRPYCGTVLLEATDLSEGRGMTSPLEVVGAPGFPADKIIKQFFSDFEEWSLGFKLREMFFVPTFNKHSGKMCSGIQIHTDNACYNYENYNPYRMMAGLFKSIQKVTAVNSLWAHFHYEYEKERLPIDLLTGSTFFREWVDNNSSSVKDFEDHVKVDEKKWQDERAAFLLY